MSPFSIASSAGGVGGLKKLKNDSVGRALRTRRVLLVSVIAAIISRERWVVVKRWQEREWRGKRTLIPLLLNLKLFRQIFLRLPFDFGADGLVVHEVASIADLLLINVCLLQLCVLEILVRREGEDQLETGLSLVGTRRVVGEVLDADIVEMLEGGSITLRNDLVETDVVPEGSEPKLRYRGSCSSGR